MIKIREAGEEDVESIYRLNCEEMGYEYSLEDTRENLRKLAQRKSEKILVAVNEDEVMGYIHANDYELLYAPPGL